MTTSYGILTTGSEILDGRIVDTNTNLIIEELASIGIAVRLTATTGDEIPDIEQALSYLHNRVDGIVVTGGLGPTTDDVTRHAIARFAGQPLERDAATVQKLEDFARQRNRPLNPTNLRQAEFPKGAVILANSRGTAPGFISVVHKKPIVSLPGVPVELRGLLAEKVLPWIREFHPTTAALAKKAFKVFGLPESEVGGRIESCTLSSTVTVSYRVVYPEIHVILKSENAAELDALYDQVHAALGAEHVFCTDLGVSFEEAVQRQLLAAGVRVAVAESMTGGLVGSMLTTVPGSSATFWGGVLTYTDRMKTELLGVPATLLEGEGAVSAAVAEAMAVGVKKRCGTEIGISVSGIAGPDLGERGIAAGTFFVGYASSERNVAFRYYFPSGRKRIRTVAAYTALDLLRRSLLGYPLRNTSPDVR